MNLKLSEGRSAPPCVALAALLIVFCGSVPAQNAPAAQPAAAGRGGPPPPPLSPKELAPEDLTGYWVSIVTEDWRFRMVTPAKGDYASVPLNNQGRALADKWDPDKDTAAGQQCKSYGAAALMRVPGRLHITWLDDKTLKIETDAGQQTRVLHFNALPPANEKPSLQGYSVASWDAPPPGRGAARGPLHAGSLKVVTTHLAPGYLRKNGVPYSADTKLTEYYSRTNEQDGTSWLIITTIVEDPTYLAQRFITSSNFRLESSGSKWMPMACEAK